MELLTHGAGSEPRGFHAVKVLLLSLAAIVPEIVAPEFAEDDIAGMTQYLINTSEYAPSGACSSAQEDEELCKRFRRFRHALSPCFSLPLCMRLGPSRAR